MREKERKRGEAGWSIYEEESQREEKRDFIKDSGVVQFRKTGLAGNYNPERSVHQI